jgi:phosphoserine phosphatase
LLFVFFFGLYLIHLLPLKTLHRISFWLLFFRQASSPLEALAKEFIETKGRDLLRPELCLECKRAQEEFGKESVFLVSSSPDFLVAPMAALLGIKNILATSYKKDELGNFCSIDSIVDGNKKRQYFEKVQAPLYVYSDSIVDLPLLELADTPIAVFPDRRLKRLAKNRGWRIIE